VEHLSFSCHFLAGKMVSKYYPAAYTRLHVLQAFSMVPTRNFNPKLIRAKEDHCAKKQSTTR
jgi:hypothetical protein